MTFRFQAVAALALIVGLFSVPAGAFEIQRVVSPGGIEAWLVEDHKIPVIAVDYLFEGGSSVEPAAKQGLANLTASLLDEGAGDLDSQAFSKKLQDDAIKLSFDAAPDTFNGGLKTLTAHRDSAFDLLALALAKPRFDAEAIERVGNSIIGEIREQQADPNKVLSRTFYAELFPDHPYGRDALGTLETVPQLSADDMRGYIARHLTRDHLQVAVTGDISPAELGPALDRMFGALPATGQTIDVPEVMPAHRGETKFIARPISQSIFHLGQPGLKRADPDWFPAYIMNYVLGGGGFSSRLTEEVREKRGLTYGVYSYLYPFRHAALLICGGATVNAKLDEALRLIRQEWARMAETGLTAEELENTKTYLTGSFPLQFTSAEAIARTVLQVRHDNLGIDYLNRRNALINAVTLEDVKRVAKRLLDPAALTTVIIGQAKEQPSGQTVGGQTGGQTGGAPAP
ncbi:MAG: pitrilysin family protein [Rhodospirillaceae bacterium]